MNNQNGQAREQQNTIQVGIPVDDLEVDQENADMPQSRRRRRNRPSLGMPVLENYEKQKQLFQEAVPGEAIESDSEPKHVQAVNPFASRVVDASLTAKKLINPSHQQLKINSNQVSPIEKDNENVNENQNGKVASMDQQEVSMFD